MSEQENAFTPVFQELNVQDQIFTSLLTAQQVTKGKDPQTSEGKESQKGQKVGWLKKLFAMFIVPVAHGKAPREQYNEKVIDFYDQLLVYSKSQNAKTEQSTPQEKLKTPPIKNKKVISFYNQLVRYKSLISESVKQQEQALSEAVTEQLSETRTAKESPRQQNPLEKLKDKIIKDNQKNLPEYYVKKLLNAISKDKEANNATQSLEGIIQNERKSYMNDILHKDVEYPLYFNTMQQGKPQSSFAIQRINYLIPENDKCSMLMALNSESNTQPQQRNLVIAFSGNAMTESDMMNSMLCSGKKIYNDFLAVGYPKGATSTKELVDAGVAAVKKAMEAGYKPENIGFSGHSLGGAIATLVLQELKKEHQDKIFNSLVVHRSFTNIGAAAKGMIGRIVSSRLVNRLANKLGLGIDPEKAIKEGLPVKQMKFYQDIDDSIISDKASIAGAVAGMEGHGVPTTVKTTKDNDHFYSFSNSLWKFPKSPMEERSEADKAKAQAKIAAMEAYKAWQKEQKKRPFWKRLFTNKNSQNDAPNTKYVNIQTFPSKTEHSIG